jgi:drug/metabolite transporter (DMT)-like permease
MSDERSPLLAGAGAALVAALSFGLTAPLIALGGKQVTGAAASSALPLAGGSPGAPLRPVHAIRLGAMALLGAALAPTLLAFGLKSVGGVTGSLLLNLEGAFTVLFAWLAYHEPIGPRVRWALGFMTLGGAALALDAAGQAPTSALGALAVAGAALGWALDNTLSRGLSQQSPLVVVVIKGALGALLTFALAWWLGEPSPSGRATLILLGCGASGYGLSLRLYLRAQRLIGAARTGSIFAVAPFIGAALGLLLGDRGSAIATGLSALCFGLGLWLHLTEGHAHRHRHEALDHDHPHRHDDGHHQHQHYPQVSGEHSHPHHHDSLEHDHPHAPDLHHEHRHS